MTASPRIAAALGLLLAAPAAFTHEAATAAKTGFCHCSEWRPQLLLSGVQVGRFAPAATLAITFSLDLISGSISSSGMYATN